MSSVNNVGNSSNPPQVPQNPPKIISRQQAEDALKSGTLSADDTKMYAQALARHEGREAQIKNGNKPLLTTDEQKELHDLRSKLNSGHITEDELNTLAGLMKKKGLSDDTIDAVFESHGKDYLTEKNSVVASDNNQI